MQQSTAVLHYGTEDLKGPVAQAIQNIYGNEVRLKTSDLTALDQFHAGGMKTTAQLMSALDLSRGLRVLDIGSGLGGPARFVEREYGCNVVGIDLNESFVELARFLSTQLGQAGLVDFRTADATKLSFEDQSFDRLYTQHVAMNIADRGALYAEAFRVLKTGGLFGMFDVISAGGEPLIYPTPWASRADMSHLLNEQQTREVLAGRGFIELSWLDQTQEGIAMLTDQLKQQQSGRTLNLSIVMGERFDVMAKNFLLNLSEGRARLVQIIQKRVS